MDWRLHGFVFSILILLVACAPSYRDLNSGLLSGKPCAAPCWNNLTPGKSTASDVKSFTVRVADDWPVRSWTESPPCTSVGISNGPGLAGEAGAVLVTGDGILTFIQSDLRNPVTLQDLVQHFGPPEYYEALYSEGDTGPGYRVEVYYPSKGLAFDIAVSVSDKGYIRPAMKVVYVQYFAPGNLLSYFTSWDCGDTSQAAVADAQARMKVIQPWTGFGEVSVVQTSH